MRCDFIFFVCFDLYFFAIVALNYFDCNRNWRQKCARIDLYFVYYYYCTLDLIILLAGALISFQWYKTSFFCMIMINKIKKTRLIAILYQKSRVLFILSISIDTSVFFFFFCFQKIVDFYHVSPYSNH